MKEKLQAKEQLKKKAEEHVETQGAELEGAYAELWAFQTELAELKEASAKYQEDALIEISQLQAQVEDSKRKLAGVP